MSRVRQTAQQTKGSQITSDSKSGYYGGLAGSKGKPTKPKKRGKS